MNLELAQLIYTKVPPERSPWKKSGFHTVLYTQGAFDKKDLLELESKLHYPGQGVFEEKLVIFPQKLSTGPHWLVVFVRSLQSRDEFGREGVFLAHGFALPEAQAQQIADFRTLIEALRPFVLASTEALLAHPEADWEAGHLPKRGVTLSEAVGPEANLPTLGPRERRLLPLLQYIAEQGTNNDALVVKGPPAEVTASLCVALAWLPRALRVRLGFDSGFDGGKLFFFPLKVVGYSQTPPTTGDPLRVDLATQVVEAHQRLAAAAQPTTYYSRWLQVHDAPLRQGQIETTYQLASFLEGTGRELPNPLELLPSFVTANLSALKATFLQRAAQQVGEPWAQRFAEGEAPEELLGLILNNVVGGSFARRVEHLILRQGLTPADIRAPLPEGFVPAGAVRLQLLMRLWRGGKLTPDDIKTVPEAERRELLDYLSRSEYRKQPWVYGLLQEEPQLLGRLLQAEDTASGLTAWLSGQFGGAYATVKHLLAEAVVHQQALGALATPNAWPEVLDRHLAQHGWSARLHRPLVALAKSLSPTPASTPVLWAIAEPPAVLPSVLAQPGPARLAYLGLLVRYPRLPSAHILALGYSDAELAAAPRAGFLQTLGAFLRRKG